MEEPKIAEKSPAVMEMEAGVYYWCACGRSANQPFCNGSHQGTSFTPMSVEIKEKKTVAWCRCKNSNAKPFCDGSHLKLK